MACAIVGSIIGMMTQTGVGTIFGGWIIGLGAKSLFLALVMTMLLSILLGTGHSDHSDLHHHRRIGRARARQTRRAADRQPHVRVLLRHHGRPLAAGGAGRAGGSADRQGKPRQDRLGGDAHRARRLCHSVRLRLFAGADAAGRRSDGRAAWILRRGGFCDRSRRWSPSACSAWSRSASCSRG